MECLGIIEAVDASNIPVVSMTTGDDGTLARIAAEIARLVPDIRQLRQEILYGLRLGQKTFGLIGQMLQATLKKNRECQLMG